MPLGFFGRLGRLGQTLGRLLPLLEGRCAGCGARPEHAAGQSALCQSALCASVLCLDCRQALAAPEALPCPGCGAWPDNASILPEPLPQPLPEPLPEPLPQPQATLCGQCLRQPRPWGHVLVHRPYEDRLRELILAYKFQKRLEVGRLLQECALAAYQRGLRTLPDLAPPDALVPVPLHPRRLLSRGFNQAREIARLISSSQGLPLDQDCLRRIRRTVPQMELAREARATNIQGAFEADPARAKGRRLMLVDDIMTTGATLEECARTLSRAGALRVDVLVLARA